MNDKKAKVAIVYHYVAHYRKGIFQRLSKDKDMNFTIISGKELDTEIRTLDQSYADTPVEDGGVRWRFVENKWLFNKFLWQKKLIREINAGNYDAVIFLGNAFFISTWLAAVIFRLKGIKVLMWGHAFLRNESGLKGWIRVRFYKLADAHFVYSARSIEIMKSRGFSEQRLHLVNNSLDHDVHLALRHDLKDSVSPYTESSGELVAIFVGRLIAQKSLSMLIEAQSLLAKKGIIISAYFIGDGPERKKLEAQASKLGLDDNVKFVGACYDEILLAEYIYHANVCISPGEVGLTAIHSLTFGTPLITHDNFEFQGPEFESVIDGVTGGFFSQGSVESLTECVERLLPMLEDRESLRDVCFRTIDENYTPEYQCRVFKKGVEQVLI